LSGKGLFAKVRNRKRVRNIHGQDASPRASAIVRGKTPPGDAQSAKPVMPFLEGDGAGCTSWMMKPEEKAKVPVLLRLPAEPRSPAVAKAKVALGVDHP
jgi:hypothetical protein